MNEDRLNLTPMLLRLGSVFVGLLVWHYAAEVLIKDSGILVSPLVVLSKAYEMMIATGELYPHLFASSVIFVYGFVLAILVGVPLGFLMALSPLVRDYVNPWMTTLYTAPRIAFAPVLLLWFGIGAGSKVAIVFWAAFSRSDQFLLRHARGQPRVCRVGALLSPGPLGVV